MTANLTAGHSMDARREDGSLDDQPDLRAKAARIAATISLLEAEYRNAIALNPHDFEAYFSLTGLLDRYKGDLVGAQAAQADGYFTLARLCEAKGDFQMAKIHSRYAKRILGDKCNANELGGAIASSAPAANAIETGVATPPAIGGDDTHSTLAVEGNTAAPAAGGDVDHSAAAENTIAVGQTFELGGATGTPAVQRLSAHLSTVRATIARI